MGSRQQTFARIGAGLTTVGLLVVLLNPPNFEFLLDFERLFFFLTAFVIWVLTEWKQSEEAHVNPPRPHPNDERISMEFVRFFSERMQRFLKTHDLGGSFSADFQEQIFAAADKWRGPNWEYEDRELQESFDQFTSALSEFGHALAEHFEPIGSAGRRIRMITTPHERMTDFFSAHTRQLANTLNSQSTYLNELGEQHSRLIRKKFPNAYTSQIDSVAP
jgi:hypothetical protein